MRYRNTTAVPFCYGNLGHLGACNQACNPLRAWSYLTPNEFVDVPERWEAHRGREGKPGGREGVQERRARLQDPRHQPIVADLHLHLTY